MSVEDRLQALLERGWRLELRTHALPARWVEDPDRWARDRDGDVVGWCVDADHADYERFHGSVGRTVEDALAASEKRIAAIERGTVRVGSEVSR